MCARGNEAGEQLWEGTGGPDGWQAECESVVSWQPGGPARQGRGLSCSALTWASLTSSAGGRLGHHKIRKTLSFRQSSKEAMRPVKGLEGKPYGEELGSFDLFSLEETE